MSFWLGGALGSGGQLVWTSPDLVVAAAAVVALLALALAAFTGRGARRPALRLAELLLWALALLVLVVAVAGPVWVEDTERSEEGKLVVLVDGSASMGVMEGQRPRGDAVAPLLTMLQAQGAEVLTFDEELRAGPPDGWTGRGTDVGVALSTIADRYLGQKLRGVVLITDGIDRGGLRRQLAEAAEAGQGATGALPPLPGPLTVYQVAHGQDLHDTAIDDVVTGGFAFLRSTFGLKAKIRGRPGARVPVQLSREGHHVEDKELVLDAQGLGEVDFQVRAPEVGSFAWLVTVPVEEDDAVPGNNSFPVVIRVVRDRIRVLQVSGSPGYDTKFLRLFLKEDPSVDLVSFFILRTMDDMAAGWRSEELSLIAFPYEQLFSEELASFDLVIFQNFDYEPYFDFAAEALLENIARYVREGGALVMTGGDRSFDIAHYESTPLAEVLPVRMGATGARTDEARFRPALTAAGEVHPITRLGANAEESAATWARLPEMDGLNLVLGPAPDSAILLEHPSLRSGEGPQAVLAVREVGQGRSMALMVDSSWRWSFGEAAAGRGNQAYLRFWKNSLRWLMADPEDQRVVVAPARENVLLGDELRVVVRVRDPGFLPMAGAEARLTVTAPDGTRSEAVLTTDASGEASHTMVPGMEGAWRLSATSPGVAAAGRSVFAVSARDPELVEIVPDPAFLERLVEVAGGEGRAVLRPPGDQRPPLIDTSAGRRVRERQETALGGAPLLALVFGLLSSLAWFLRRRAGAR